MSNIESALRYLTMSRVQEARLLSPIFRAEDMKNYMNTLSNQENYEFLQVTNKFFSNQPKSTPCQIIILQNYFETLYSAY